LSLRAPSPCRTFCFCLTLGLFCRSNLFLIVGHTQSMVQSGSSRGAPLGNSLEAVSGRGGAMPPPTGSLAEFKERRNPVKARAPTSSTELMSRSEIAHLLGVCVETIDQYSHGQDPLPRYRIGRKYLYNLPDVMAWMKRQATK